MSMGRKRRNIAGYQKRRKKGAPVCRIEYADDCYGFWREEPHQASARKEYRCSDCGRSIVKGERYTSGVWLDTDDHSHTALHMCLQCVEAGAWLRKVCGGHFWPGVLEELEEHWQEEFEYRSFGLGRLVLYGQRKWQRSDGCLVSVDAVRGWVDQALTRIPTHGAN